MKKIVISGGLFLAAILWVGLLSLLTGGGGEESVSVPAADGSQATIELVDKSQFYKNNEGEIALQMEIRGPDQKPIPGLSPKNLQLEEEGIPVPVKSFQGPGMQAINVFLVIDISGSMSSGIKMEEARQAAISAVNELRVDRDRIGVIAFDDRYNVVHPMSDLTAESKSRCLQSLQMLRPNGGTVIGPPTLAAIDLFKQSGVEGAKLLMVMTDGQDPQLVRMIDPIAEASDAQGVPVYTIAFGERFPEVEQMLRSLASQCSGEYYFAPTGEKLAEIYRSRVQDASEQFLITYNSPWPDADGLNRRVRVGIETPSGTLEAGGQYQIGPIISGGSRKAPRVASVAGGENEPVEGGGAMVLQIIMFLVLLAALSGGLAASEFSPQLRSVLGTAATPSQSTAPTSQPLVSPTPPPPPPKLPGQRSQPVKPGAASPTGPPPPPAQSRPPVGSTPPPPKPSTPTQSTPASSKPTPSKPATKSPVPETTTANTPPPPRPRGPAKTPPRPSAPGTQKISPIPPPPPPPGKKPKGE